MKKRTENKRTRKSKLPEIEVSARDAMNLKCLECCCGDWGVVLDCKDQMCALLLMKPKRRRDALKAKFWNDETTQLIARPKVKSRSRTMTEEQKKAAGERMRKIRNQNA